MVLNGIAGALKLMKDDFGRHIDYLRISLTDRCNFRCLYCMPEDGVEMMAHKDILTFEELLRISGIAGELGVTKVRLTGGEPLVRKGVVSFIKDLRALPAIESISMTTNGYYLEELARELKRSGLDRLNISLDTVDREKFRELTRRDGFDQVIRGISAAQKAGFQTIKINSVAVRGRNDDEIIALARFAEERGLILRFIEQMPFNDVDRNSYMAASEIMDILRIQLGEPVKIEDRQGHVSVGHGPAELYRFGQSGPIVGFITPVSNHFCGSCNRLRITADGKLKPCLLSREEVDLRASLREGCSDGDLKQILADGICQKPEGHNLDSHGVESIRGMSKIGG